MTKLAIFENSRWRTADILKIALSPYLSRKLSDFDQIWYEDANFHTEDGCLPKNRNFANSRWRTDAILKIVFLVISRRHIGRLMRNLERRWIIITRRYMSHDQNSNFRKFKIAEGRHFENSFISISQPWFIRFRSNLVHIYKFPFRTWKFDIKSIFSNLRWRTDAIL